MRAAVGGLLLPCKDRTDQFIDYFKLPPKQWETRNRDQFGEARSQWKPPLNILIVCDRLLPYFDAPVEPAAAGDGQEDRRGRRDAKKLPGQDSNLDKESQKNFSPDSKSESSNDLRAAALSLTAGLAPDDDLARIVNAWPRLAAPIRRAILALVESAG